MRILSLFITTLFLLFFAKSNAQTLEKSVNLSEGLTERDQEGNFVFVDLFTFNQGDLYSVEDKVNIIGVRHNNPSLVRYSSDLSKKEIGVWNFNYEGEFGDYLHTVLLNGTPYFITRKKIEETQSEHLYVWEFDEENYTLINKKKIAKIDQSRLRRWHFIDYLFAISPDSSHMAIFYEPPMRRSERNRTVLTETLLLDNNFEVIHQFSHGISEKNIQIGLIDFVVGNNGEIYILTSQLFHRLFHGPHRQVRKSFHLIAHLPNHNKTIQKKLKPKDGYISNIRIALSTNNYIYAFGLNSNKWNSRRQLSRGLSVFKIKGSTADIIWNKNTNFPIDFLAKTSYGATAQSIRNRVERGRTVQIDEFILDYVLPGSEDDFILVGEQRRNRKPLGRNISSEIEDVYLIEHEGIVALNVTSDGVIQWGQNFRRNHSRENKEISFLRLGARSLEPFSEYEVIQSNNNLYLFYNDHPKNIDRNVMSRPARLTFPRNTDWMMTKITQDGGAETISLNSYAETSLLLLPRLTHQIATSEIAIFAAYKRDLQLFKLQLN